MTTPSLLRIFSTDLAIDLGTANTLVFERKKGIVVNEPSIVALRKDSGAVEAVGTEAKEMLGRTPEQITAVKPMKNGVIADFGGGTTDVAVISLAGLVYSHSVRVAGNAMDERIVEFVKRKHNLLIGERTAETVKIQIGSAHPLPNPMRMEVRGRDLLRGIPGTVVMDDTEVREALAPCVSAIVDGIRAALEHTPPELSADISDRGVVLTGGSALLRSLDTRIRKETGLPVSIAEDPLTSVVVGAGKM